MKKVSPVFLLTISDIFTNLSAGWFGAAFILPAFSERPLLVNVPLLIMDLFSGIVFGTIAVKIRQYIKRRKR